ncbi:MAG: stimulus-sensing domain-containing protein [Alphaproteobacteria bacterium]|nr:stimulus-sensing domain-containing protein [Alphaproteobacteria bacterium]
MHISPLSLRILAVNVAALLVLVVGLLYTGQYERSLIDNELNALQAEGRLVMAALAQNGVRETEEGVLVLAEDLARHALRDIIDTSRLRILVFDKTGTPLLDSHQLLGPGGIVEMVELDPPKSTWNIALLTKHYTAKALSLLPTRLKLKSYPAAQKKNAGDYPGILPALEGAANKTAWRDQDERLLMTASLPVQKLKNVLGAALLMRDGKTVTNAVTTMQITVLKIFGLALSVTVLLSLYLSEAIVRPIVRLALATKNVRRSLTLKDELPDLSYRGDEIGDLSTAFRDMTFALADRIDSIHHFAADVAHEIKNPLASVQSAVETLARVQDPAQQKQLLDIIRNDVQRMTRLVTDISTASRLDSELRKAERTTFNFTDTVRHVIDTERTNAEQAKKDIIFSAEKGQRIPITGNEVQLAQVVHNLIDNALSFSIEDGKIVILLKTEKNRAFLTVDNEGPHIPEDKMETIFSRFYSERPKTEKFGQHSGLGLSITRQIISLHHGEVFAANLKDADGTPAGVRFTVILPLGASIG